MTLILDVLGGLFLVCGTTFLLLGGLGLVRMPDLYNRIQAGTKATTLGTLMSLLGVFFLYPAWGWKLLLIYVFLIFTNPLSSQVLARAAHRSGIEKNSTTIVDHLADEVKKS